MAEANQDTTFLDKLISAGEIGSPSLALIPGLTRAQEDQMIRDIADNAVGAEEDYLANEKGDYDAAHRSRMYRLMATDQLEDMIHNMPEDMQDQWVLSAWNAGPPIYDNSLESSYYSPNDNRIYLKSYSPSSYIHEVAHYGDYNMSKPSFMYRHPASTNVNLGKAIYDEKIGGLSYRWNNGELSTEKIRDESPSLYGLDRENSTLPMRQQVGDFTTDMMSLSPIVDDYGEYSTFGTGHGSEYRDSMRETELAKGLEAEKAKMAAMSIEGYADLHEIMATPDGKDFVIKNFPITYELMMDMYDSDVRIRALRNGGVADGIHYALPYKYTSMQDTKEYDRNHPRQYFRTKSPYGYSYAGSGRQAKQKARQMGKESFEWKDNFGDWQRENLNRLDMPKAPTFNDQFNYYVDTPYGRKGYNDSYDVLLHMAAFPGEENVYHKASQVLDDGTIETSWEKSYPQFWRRTVHGTDYDKKQIEEMKKQRELLERARQNRKSMGLPSLVKKVR